MTTTKEQAGRDWSLHAFKRVDYPHSYKTGVSDFKSALREEIEKKADEQNYNGADDWDDGYVFAMQEVLKLLDTVTPKK